ncbi:MAG: hypothetical protein GX425_05315 [Peptococcaceae bacterium]|nr:hypothetical protein [Peptococcaceae bacterium]
MSTWWTLLQKEYRMTRNAALLSLAILIIGGLWLVYLSYRYHAGIIFAPAAFILVILLFYPAMYILKSLAWEWKVTPHLWLHCPQPGWLLLAAKLAIALLQMLVITIITAALLLLTLSINPTPVEMEGIVLSSLIPIVVEIGFYAAVFVFAASIYIGSWATLISVTTALAGNILGRLRWLAGIATFFVATVGLGKLHETGFYDLITHWGPLSIQPRTLPEIAGDLGMHINMAGHVNLVQFYTGEVFFYFLLTAALFALSAWLIDHKVEV